MTLGERFRSKTYFVTHSGFAGNIWSKSFDIGIIALILLNVVLIFEESLNLIQKNYWVTFIELTIISVFGIEFFVRVWCCVENEYAKSLNVSHFKTRIKYLFKFMTLVDFLAFFPFIILFMTDLSDIDIRLIKTLQLIRILKLTRIFGYLQLIVQVLNQNVLPLIGSMIILLNLTLLAAIGIHFFERELQPETFGNLGQALWWGLITLTTVGYGDAVPITTGGKILTFVLILMSLGIVGIPVAVVTASLNELTTKKRSMRKFIRIRLRAFQTENLTEQVLQFADDIELRREDAMATLAYEKKKTAFRPNLLPSSTMPNVTKGIMQCPHCLREIKIRSHE